MKIEDFLNMIQTEDDEHLEMPKRCSEMAKAERGEQCHQTFMGLLWPAGSRLKGDAMCRTDPFALLKTLDQLEWLKSNIQCKKKCLPLKDSEQLEQLCSWGVTGGKCRGAHAPASSSATVYAFQLPRQCNEEPTVVMMCQTTLWKNNHYFSGIWLHSQWGGTWDG